MAQEKKMKFKPRFIEAFRSGQKITSLRMMDFKCRIHQKEEEKEEGKEFAYFHEDTLKYYTSVKDIDHLHLSLSSGTTIEYLSDFDGLLERQPYKQGDEIELVTEIEGGEIMPFATATIAEILVIKGDQIDDVQAIMDGFNPDRDPLSDLLAFMRCVCPDKDPVRAMYWLYTFTNIQMLSGWEGDA